MARLANPIVRAQVALLALAWLAGCGRVMPPLPQRGYLWQRHWEAAVAAGAREAAAHLDGLVLLAGELEWREGKPNLVKADIDWEVVRGLGKPCALALRVAPAAAGQLSAEKLAATAGEVLAEARAQGVAVAEFQLDFDCGQKSLAAYRDWLARVRPAVAPARLVVTALPAWLPEPAWPVLLREVDGYVLQVHSVPLRPGGSGALCDPERARAWVAAASRLGRPFSVALPTYYCVAGYAPTGSLLGVAMDGAQPAWPPGTRPLELASDPRTLAPLVAEWQHHRPAGLREILWYRVPIATEERNWRWPELAAVMQGRAPERRYEVEGASRGALVDLTLSNVGEDDAPFRGWVEVVSAEEEEPLAAEMLRGWSWRRENGGLRLEPPAGVQPRLPPGQRRAIGWLRYAQAPSLRLTVHPADP